MKKLLTLGLVIALFASAASVIAGTSLLLKNSNDVGVDVIYNEDEDPNDSFSDSVFWKMINNGNSEIPAQIMFGYSRYDFENQEWIVIQQDIFKRTLAPHGEPYDSWGTGILNIDLQLELGYYMFWAEYREDDRIKENNIAREFVWIE